MIAKIETPAECKQAVGIDHGMELVHDFTGEPRNYLHEISIPKADVDGIYCLIDAGYTQHHGYIAKDDTPMWVYVKQYPLMVAEWLTA